ncbi:hypothetical protein PFBG_00720, partial [Plasmodium falciparum 7G8]
MAPGDPQGGGSGGAHGSGDAEKYKNATNVKDLLDMIGADVYNEVKSEANQYKEALTGQLSLASIWKESASTTEPCKLINDEGQKLIHARGDPCGNTTGKDEVPRFSKERVAEYDEKKIRGNKGKGGNNEGECAPYRRLSLCNKNMEKKGTTKITDKNDLLADVCMAANFEGESIKTHYKQYEVQYPGSGHTTCTMLARSFADIGDIIRGKDLYGRNNRKRKQLEENLQKYFENIYYGLSNETNAKELQERYKDDTPDFFKLREDWWSLNRETVWKAMTCSADRGNAYFRATCGDEKKATLADVQCRCTKPNADQVPTSFDYVPQFLRWFEEWAEDFCRKKNKKIKDVQKQCRGENGKDKYCSRNGFDCEKTKRAIGKLRYGNQCTKCFFACYPYVDWIENQRKQFDKQVKKYTNEISGGGAGGSRKKRNIRDGSNDNGYEKIFYEKLQSNGYGSVDAFLEKLSKENVCTKITEKEEGKINFKEVNSGSTNGDGSGDSGTNDINNGTFYRSEYCQPCPICGVKKKRNGGSGWEEKNNGNCTRGNLYKPIDGATPTDNTILKSGEGETEIKEKLEQFCNQANGDTTNNGGNGTGGVANGNGGSGSKELYQEWKCYKGKDVQKVVQDDDEDYDDDYHKEVENAGGLCILKNNINKKEKPERSSQMEPEQFQKTFNDFFYYWVVHMLKDSIYWRTKKLERCLENGTKTRCNKKNKCKDDCDCFQRWVEKKKTEWENIKKHFNTQENLPWDPVSILEQVLDKEVLLTSLQEGYGNEKDIEHIKQLLEEDEKEENQGTASTDSQKKNTIDKLLQHEAQEAEKCKQKQDNCNKQSPPTDGGSPDRSKTPAATTTSTNPTEEEDHENTSDEEDPSDSEEDHVNTENNDQVEVMEETVAEVTDIQKAGQTPAAPTVTVDVCATVAKALGGNLNDACRQKYGGNNSRLGWKCIPTGNTSNDNKGESSGKGDGAEAKIRTARSTPDKATTSSSNTGAICIPPRRRKLYIDKIKKWAEKQTQPQEAGAPQVVSGEGKVGTESQSSSSSSSSPPSNSRDVDDLLTAFVESAAVETFFLWDRYKKDKEREYIEKQRRGGYIGFLEENQQIEENPNSPLNALNKGEIHDEFMRQMFYTLGDYRDILYSGDNENGNKYMFVDDIKDISDKIKSILNSDVGEKTTAKQWWEKNGEHIWNGMICALTYTQTSSSGGDKTTTINQDSGLKEKLWDENTKKPKENIYNYTNAKFVDNDNTNGPLAPDAPQHGQTTKLTEFISRPPYFRYLEEWGETFCHERRKRLEKIEEECRGENDNRNSSGDGEDCKTIFRRKYDTVPSFEYPGCGRECRKYKKWIERKGKEFEEQKQEYSKQKTDAEGNNNGNEFYKKLTTTYKEAKNFLENLGPCKKDKENVKDKLDFDKPNDTFRPATNCDPCSQFKINCKNGNCRSGGGTNDKCDGKTPIVAKDIETIGKSPAELIMRISDNGSNGFEGDGLQQACGGAGIFKGIKENKWKCRNVCGYVVCKPENINGETVSWEKDNGKHIIQIRALFKRWVEYFFEDYKKITHKISHCKENDEKNICKKDCKDKCTCVDKWIKLKQQEWEKIKERFNEQYKNADSDNSFPVRSILENLIPQIAVTDVKNEVIKISKFDKSCGCSASAHSPNGKDDAIECMIKKLEEKAKECKENHTQPSGENQAPCEESSSEPDDEPLEEIEENQVAQPAICPKVDTTEEEETDDKCEEATATPKEPAPTTPKDTEADSGKGTEELPSPPEEKAPLPKEEKKNPKRSRRRIKHPNPWEHPIIIPSLATSTLMWTVGIGFA